MKKIITLLLVLTGMVSTVNATKIYFKPNVNWKTDGACFAYIQQNSSGGNIGSIVLLNEIAGLTGYYSAEVDIDESCDKLKFLRIDPNYSVLSWDAVWNGARTVKPTTDTYYVLTEEVWDDWNTDNSITSKTIYDSWVLAGNRHITNGYKEWTGSAEDAPENVMSSANGLIYSVTVAGKALKAGTYEFKYYRGGDTWIGDGNNNFTVNIENDGIYTLIFSYNQISDTKNVDISGSTEATVEYRYYVSESPAGITDGELKLMTIADSKATYTVSDVKLVKDHAYTFRIVEEVYKDGTKVEGSTYEASNPSTAGAWSVSSDISTNLDVKFVYDIPSNYEYTAANVYATLSLVADSYYFILNALVPDSWYVGDKLTTSDDIVYAGTLRNWHNKMFAIVPSAAITGLSTIDWDQVIRPNYTETGNRFVDFPWNYDEATATTNNNKVWHVWVEANNGSIDFTYTPSQNKWTASPFIPLTISNGYATFSYPKNDAWGHVVIPTGITAYYATDATVGQVKMTSIDLTEFPVSEGVFLKAEDTTQEYKLYSGSAWNDDEEKDNLLVKGTATGVPATDEANNLFRYVYAKQGGETGFFNVATEVTQNMTGKAYLETATSIKPVSGARVAIIFDGEGETTGIKQIETAKQSVEGYYNLAGQRVAQPTKGLYIVNGKKVIMK